MPVSPDLGTSIARVVQAVAEVGGRQSRTEIQASINLFLRGDSNIAVGEIVFGLITDSMRSMGFGEDDAKRVLVAGIAELTQAEDEPGGL